jgi:hypothetical protein
MSPFSSTARSVALSFFCSDLCLQQGAGKHALFTPALPQGRSGVGSSNHCAHGNSISTQVVMDWHPF